VWPSEFSREIGGRSLGLSPPSSSMRRRGYSFSEESSLFSRGLAILSKSRGLAILSKNETGVLVPVEPCGVVGIRSNWLWTGEERGRMVYGLLFMVYVSWFMLFSSQSMIYDSWMRVCG